MRRPYFAKAVSAKRRKTGVWNRRKNRVRTGFLDRFSALKQKMSGKTGWLCYAKKSGCDILYKKMKSKNVSLAVEIYPREGTKTLTTLSQLLIHFQVEIYPREGTKTGNSFLTLDTPLS